MASPIAPAHQNYSWVGSKVTFTSMNPLRPGSMPILAMNSITGIGNTNDTGPQRGLGGMHLGFTDPIKTTDDFTVDMSLHNWHEFCALFGETDIINNVVTFACTITSSTRKSKVGAGIPNISVIFLQGAHYVSHTTGISYGPDPIAVSVVFRPIGYGSGDAVTAVVNAARGNLPQ